jgi:hypothetical protein
VGFLSSLFGESKPAAVVIIRNVLGEEIDRVQAVWDLSGVDLRGRNWSHAECLVSHFMEPNAMG